MILTILFFFIHNLEKGFPEVLQFLNFKREELVEDRVKVIFWVTEEELSRISREAPDFFAFRNRVVEFMEVPHAGRIGGRPRKICIRDRI